MKHITFIIICLLSINVFAQSKKEIQEVKQSFWGANDLASNDLSIPEKWKGESAVILFKNIKYDYHKSGNNVTYTSAIRKQVLLKDEAAIDRYSEFSKADNFFTKETRFWTRENMEFIGIRIIKPSGEIENIAIKEVSVKKDDESYIAVPNLEIGDIIDFYIEIKQAFMPATVRVFKPVENLISETYPIKDFKMNFNVDNDFYINYKSFNGAPDLIPINTDKKKNKTYEITDSDIEKIKIEKWSYLFNEVPCYKMQVYYAKTKSLRDRMSHYSSKGDNIILNKATDEEIIKVAGITSKPLPFYNYYKEDFKTVFADKNIIGVEEQLKYLFYYIRYKCTILDMDYNMYKYENVLENTRSKYKTLSPAFFISGRNEFINYFITYLNENNISYDLVIGKRRYDGLIDDLLLSSNEELALRINLPEKSLFIQWHRLNGNFNSISPYLLSTEAYALTPGDKWTLTKPFYYENLEKFNLPNSNSNDHKISQIIKVKLNDFESVTISDSCEMYGSFKGSGQSKMLTIFDIINDDYKHYDRKPFIEMVKAGKKQMVSIKERIKAYKNTLRKETDDRVKANIESDFSFTLEDDFTYDVLELGRFDKSSPFKYITSFEIKDQLLKKAGPNYILEVGKLIGPQVSIKEDQLEREYAIDMVTSRELDNSIEIEIPEGYQVKGVDKLVKSIENETGSFSSTAKVNGNTLMIKTRKVYKKHHLPKEKWSELVAVLDLAFKFSEENILLKKLK